MSPLDRPVRVGWVLVVVSVLGAAELAVAEGRPPPPHVLEASHGPLRLDIAGEWRGRLTRVGAIDPVDPAVLPDVDQPAALWVENRLRFAPRLAWEADVGPLRSAELVARLDLAEGVVGGDPVPERAIRPDGIDAADLDHLWLGLDLGVARARVGRQGSRWGLGLVASDGAGEPDFGDRRFGDRVDRIGLGTALGRLQLSAAVDRVVEDDLTLDGWDDDAWNLILAALHGGERLETGLYAVYRTQENDRDSDTRIVALDLFFAMDLGAWYVEGEGALGFGRSEIPRTPASPDAADVLEHGGLVRGGWRGILSGLAVEAVLEGGWASGDDDPFDDELHDFTFDPDLNVGIVLFEEYLAALTAASGYNLGDPLLVGSPPVGAYLVATDGGVRNAWYLHPRLLVRQPGATGFEAKLALVFARSIVDVVDPFASFVAGGELTNHRGGRPGDRDLGLEISGGLAYRIEMQGVRIRTGIEGGQAWPGGAFRDARGRAPDPVGLVQGRVTVAW